MPGNDLRQVVHTHVPLSPSSIIWYRLHRWESNDRGLAYHLCSWVSAHCRLRAYETKMTTAPADTELWDSPVDYGSFTLPYWYIAKTMLTYSSVISITECSELDK